MVLVEDVVIVGAGISGLTTCLGLHRYFSFLVILLIMDFSDIYLLISFYMGKFMFKEHCLKRNWHV